VRWVLNVVFLPPLLDSTREGRSQRTWIIPKCAHVRRWINSATTSALPLTASFSRRQNTGHPRIRRARLPFPPTTRAAAPIVRLLLGSHLLVAFVFEPVRRTDPRLPARRYVGCASEQQTKVRGWSGDRGRAPLDGFRCRFATAANSDGRRGTSANHAVFDRNCVLRFESRRRISLH